MLVSLEYTRQDGSRNSRIVNVRLLDSIEADPRPGAVSKSIVKLSDGTKLYCVQTPAEILAQTKGGQGE